MGEARRRQGGRLQQRRGQAPPPVLGFLFNKGGAHPVIDSPLSRSYLVGEQ